MLDPNKPVRVFRNWKHHCYSIMQGGAVRASARAVLLADVEFVVREAARLRMVESGKKTVHAFAVGHLVDLVHPEEPRKLGGLDGRIAWYDPLRYPTFVDRATGAPLRTAALVQLDESGIVYATADPHSAPLAA